MAHIVLVDSPVRELNDRKGVDCDVDCFARGIEARATYQHRWDFILGRFVRMNVHMTKFDWFRPRCLGLFGFDHCDESIE